MSNYNPNEIEKKWQEYWRENETYKAVEDKSKEKFYVLDMFPYPSGAGLHVGHPLGYIASDIYSRYKKHLGYNVLHPMGYDSFGLPAEQYAIQTGQHPAITTEKNIARYREQLDKIGFAFDWSREVRTSDPSYYKWTQWIFKQLFNSWYNNDTDKAESIESLISIFENEGNTNVNAVCEHTNEFCADEWNAFDEKQQQNILMNYRLTFLSETWVNWCPELGTVLANDEIKDGVSERGGYPVVQKLMMQWSMRITAYAERLLQGLDKIDFSEALKEQQRNWIGKSKGASIKFKVLSPNPSPQERGIDDNGDKLHYLTGNPANASLLLEKAKEMRANPTKAEEALWKQLKTKQLANHKFRQQHLIDNYIVDFVCLDKQLIVEVDGKIHDYQKEQDGARTEVLESLGYKVLRFDNDEVLKNIESVLRRIEKELSNRKSVREVLPNGKDLGWEIEVFTTRPDTIFGVTFMVLAPEHPLVDEITTAEYKAGVEAYKQAASLKTERDRQANVKEVTGQFTGAYAVHPFTGEDVQIWIGEYVLATYGTGAVMAVPAGDQRDYDFAKHFNIPIPNIFEGVDISEEACADKSVKLTNSDFLNGMLAADGIEKAIEAIEEKGFGKGKINYRLRDAIFSRQRYWGEPFPIYYKDDVPYVLNDDQLPVTLPDVDKYLPTEDGEPPLARAKKESWNIFEGDRMEYNTMPGWAGSSWYFLRYMDPHNENEFAGKESLDYWNQVDLYIGGAEHAVGHLLYSRFWTKFLYDRGFIGFDEPFKKLINQGMILGRSSFIYRVHVDTVRISVSGEQIKEQLPVVFVSKNLRKSFAAEDYLEIARRKHPDVSFNLLGDGDIKFTPLHVDINFVENDLLDISRLCKALPKYNGAEFILEDGKYICGNEVEKMSKSKYNVQTPDELVEKFGADTLRCYEMFLGPLEQSKPWDVQGINGVNNFLKKLWRLFYNNDAFSVLDAEPTKDELKVLHTAIKKVSDDLNRYSFNTVVSTLMIAVNELSSLKCNNKTILSELVVLVAPYAPHIAEELWNKLGNSTSVTSAQWPKLNESYLVEDNFEYPVSFNGKMRFKLEAPMELDPEGVKALLMQHEKTAHYLEGKDPKKIIVVPKRIINVVV